jgi:ceramide glucosyltransferase
MTIALLIAGFVALAYQLVALAAALHHMTRTVPERTHAPAVSILKPVHGLDDEFYAAIRSHAEQEYGEFEILFGVRGADPARAEIERLQAEFPGVAIRVIEATNGALNEKVGKLIDLAREARFPVLLVNDSDISVPKDYLRRVAAPLSEPGIGLVTCLYRAAANSTAGQWEALGINTDFMPSTLVAPLVGIREFGLGSTLCFRREDLEAIGGFESIADYIADDYQLAKRITGMGKRAYLSEVVVETHLSDPDWSAVWAHQVRWARTIRVSRFDGYIWLPVTQAGFWALLCAAGGLWWMAAVLCGAKILTGVTAGWGVLRSRLALRGALLIPLWDWWAFVVYATGLFGDRVQWRDKRMKLSRDGRLLAG